MTYWN